MGGRPRMSRDVTCGHAPRVAAIFFATFFHR